jgi:hypothetical protein
MVLQTLYTTETRVMRTNLIAPINIGMHTIPIHDYQAIIEHQQEMQVGYQLHRVLLHQLQ